jgi:aspartate/methionine/tyrosine aminotransferase
MPGARRLDDVVQSMIRDMTRLAMKYDAINLSQGMPEDNPPPEVIEAAVEALRGGGNQYSITWGTRDLRAAIAEKYQRWYGMVADPETEVTVTCGVTEAVVAALMAHINPGDRVIIVEPAHENYLAAVRFAGGEPVWISLRPPDFDLDEEEFRRAFAQRPKAILLNTPSNPTGRVFDREFLSFIAELCVEHDVLAVSDEIYEHITYDGHEHIPIATLPGMAERTITTGGCSKTYSATGWRIAWVVAPEAISEPIRTVHDYMTICAPTPLQAAALVALGLPNSIYDGLIVEYTKRRDAMMQVLEGSGFEAKPPQGAYYVMADYGSVRSDMDDIAFARWLTSERRVAVVPGSTFYNGNPDIGKGMVRFAFPKRVETLKLAGERLKGA